MVGQAACLAPENKVAEKPLRPGFLCTICTGRSKIMSTRISPSVMRGKKRWLISWLPGSAHVHRSQEHSRNCPTGQRLRERDAQPTCTHGIAEGQNTRNLPIIPCIACRQHFDRETSGMLGATHLPGIDSRGP